jgi:hypothetical protein
LPSSRGWRSIRPKGTRHLGLELGQLVQEEDTVVGQAHLARLGDRAAADETGVGDGVVGRAERASGDEGSVRGQEAGDGVDHGASAPGTLGAVGWENLTPQ